MWLEFLQKQDICSRPFIDFIKVLSADKINLYTDASRAAHQGFGCVFGNSWMQGTWEKNYITELNPSIENLELYA